MTPHGPDDWDDADDGNGLDALDFDTPVLEVPLIAEVPRKPKK